MASRPCRLRICLGSHAPVVSGVPMTTACPSSTSSDCQGAISYSLGWSMKGSDEDFPMMRMMLFLVSACLSIRTVPCASVSRAALLGAHASKSSLTRGNPSPPADYSCQSRGEELIQLIRSFVPFLLACGKQTPVRAETAVYTQWSCLQ